MKQLLNIPYIIFKGGPPIKSNPTSSILSLRVHCNRPAVVFIDEFTEKTTAKSIG